MALFIITAEIHDGPTDRILIASVSLEQAETEAMMVADGYDTYEVEDFTEEKFSEMYGSVALLSGM